MNIKIILSHIIARVPTNYLRVNLYKYILSYKIKNSKIGYGTVIAVKEFDISGSYVGKNNTFYGPIEVKIKDNCKISDGNNFHCGYWLNKDELKNAKLSLLGNVNITSNHYFDISGGISIGKDSWVAGRSSQFWTHGAGQRPQGIIIDEGCYIGSSAKFVQNINIGKFNTVSLGAIVCKSFKEEKILIAGCPAQIKKHNYSWIENK